MKFVLVYFFVIVINAMVYDYIHRPLYVELKIETMDVGLFEKFYNVLSKDQLGNWQHCKTFRDSEEAENYLNIYKKRNAKTI